MNIPKYLFLFLTDNCNLSCRHCYASFSSQKKRNFLPLQTWYKILSDCINNDVFFYHISGGEPTVYPYFDNILEYLSSKNQYFTLSSNGIFSEDKQNTIIKYQENLISIQFSLDGYDHNSYNYLRNIKSNETFEILIRRLKYFISIGIKIELSICIHSETLYKIKEFCELINDIKPYRILVTIITDIGSAKELPDKDKIFNEEQIKKLIDDFNNFLNPDIDLVLSDLPYNDTKTFGYICPIITDFFSIDCEGFLLPCPNFLANKKDFSFPNVIDLGLQKSINSDIMKYLLNAKLNPCILDNKKCGNIKRCDRCIAQSLVKGDIYAPPDFCVQNKDFLFK